MLKRRASVVSVTLILLAALLASRAFSATVTLTAVADTELSAQSPDGNTGTSPTMVSGTQGPNVGSPVNRAVMRFDLSSIPANVTITSVTLGVTVVRIPAGPADSNFRLHRSLTDWTESGATWLYTGIENWGEPGGLPDSNFVSTASASVFVTGAGGYTFASTTGLVADVQQWVGTPTANFGWFLVSEREDLSKTARHFGTHEGAGAPVLTVGYTVPVLPQITNSARVGGEFQFQFNAEAGHAYVVESRAILQSGNWNPFTNFPAGGASTVTVKDALGAGPKFYRLGRQ